MSNVRNVSVISVVSCIESSKTPTTEPIIHPIEVVDEKDAKNKMDSPTRRRGLRFDPPLDFNANIPRASFPSRLTVAQGGSFKGEGAVCLVF